MKVSVLMPIFNTPEPFLRAAVESILGQSLRDFEFLILNDSPANTALDAIVASYGDGRIRYFKNDRSLGIAEAHNFLLERSSGEYVAMMDHDDLSRPERLSRQAEFMDAHPEVGVCSTAFRRFGRFGKNRTVVNPADDASIRALMLFQCPLLHPAAMMRRSVMIEHALRWDPQFISANDVKLYLDFSRHSKLANLTEVLYDYRLSRQQTSKVKGEAIRKEGVRYHAAVCEAMGLSLDESERVTLNDYILRGRCRVESWTRFRQIRRVLAKLEAANAASGFGDRGTMARVCAHRLRSRFFKWLFGSWFAGKTAAEESDAIAEELSATIAAAIGRQYRLRRLSARSTYPVFKGEADGAPPVFVKLGRADEWRRTANLFRDVGDFDLFARLMTEARIEFRGQSVFVTEWRDTRILYPEDMSDLQADDFTDACVRLSEALRNAKDFVPLGTVSGGEGSTLGMPPEAFYEEIVRYVKRHPLAGRLLRDLTAIPVAERTYASRTLSVIHGDFHSKNFGFSGDRLAAVFDFEGLTQGLACGSLVNALVERYSLLSMPAAKRRRLDEVARRIFARQPWPREELAVVANVLRLQYAARRIRKHPASAWVAFDVLRRDRRIRRIFDII